MLRSLPLRRLAMKRNFVNDFDLLYPYADKWHMQELAGAVAKHRGPALALGWELVVNGGFTDWTGTPPNDSPDGWTVTQAGGTIITQNPAGHCQISRNGTTANLTQSVLSPGKTYLATLDITANVSGQLEWGNIGGTGGTTEVISGVGAKSFEFVAGTSAIFVLNANGTVVDITIDNVSIKQTNIAASAVYPGSELLDESGNGVMDKDNWTALNNAALSNPSPGVLRITRDGTNNPQARQTVLTVGERDKAIGGMRSDGFAQPRVSDLTTDIVVGTTSTSRQPFNEEFVATSTEFRLRVVTSTGTEFCEFDALSLKPANPMHGDSVDVLVGKPADGNLGYGYGFADNISFVNIYSPELNSKFNPNAGTLIAFAQNDDWTGTRYIVNLFADMDNRLNMFQFDGDLIVQIVAGGIDRSINVLPSGSDNGYHMYTITWDETAVIGYLDDVAISALSAAGTWVENLSPTDTVIGASNTTPNNPWDGDIGHVYLVNRALSPIEIANIWQRSGLFYFPQPPSGFSSGFDSGFN